MLPLLPGRPLLPQSRVDKRTLESGGPGRTGTVPAQCLRDDIHFVLEDDRGCRDSSLAIMPMWHTRRLCGLHPRSGCRAALVMRLLPKRPPITESSAGVGQVRRVEQHDVEAGVLLR